MLISPFLDFSVALLFLLSTQTCSHTELRPARSFVLAHLAELALPCKSEPDREGLLDTARHLSFLLSPKTRLPRGPGKVSPVSWAESSAIGGHLLCSVRGLRLLLLKQQRRANGPGVPQWGTFSLNVVSAWKDTEASRRLQLGLTYHRE